MDFLQLVFFLKKNLMTKRTNNRHKWSGKSGKERPVGCVRCGCVKEIVKSGVIYFINDCVYYKAPKCV